MTLPPRQAACLALIVRWWQDEGESPTRAELGRAMGIHKVSAHLLVSKLERAGHVVTHRHIWRNIEIT